MVRKFLRSGPVIVAVLVATLSGCGGGGDATQALAPVATLVPIVSVSPTPAPSVKASPKATPKATPKAKPKPQPSPTSKPATGGQDVQLAIKNFNYMPSPLQMRVGQTLVVTNLDSAVHTI